MTEGINVTTLHHSLTFALISLLFGPWLKLSLCPFLSLFSSLSPYLSPHPEGWTQMTELPVQ